MCKTKVFKILLVSVLLHFQSGCIVLGQFARRDFDIRGKVVMPDGKQAENVELFVSYGKIVQTQYGPDGKDFWEKIHSKDGTFHVQYSLVCDVSIRALKPGYRSNIYIFDLETKRTVKDLVVELVEVGQRVDPEKLHWGKYRFSLEPEAAAAGIKLRPVRLLTADKAVPIEMSDLYFERAARRDAEGKVIAGLVLKAAEGFGMHLYSLPQRPANFRISYDTTPMPPKDGYVQEIWLPLNKEVEELRMHLKTREGKFGDLVIQRITVRGGGDGEPAVDIELAYRVQPDGSRNLDVWDPPVRFDGKGKPIEW